MKLELFEAKTLIEVTIQWLELVFIVCICKRCVRQDLRWGTRPCLRSNLLNSEDPKS